MLRKEMDIHQRTRPIPITVLVSTANSYLCDIFIEYECENETFKVNVKSYDEMKNGLRTPGRILLFYFNGLDEKKAESRIEKLFEQ